MLSDHYCDCGCGELTTLYRGKYRRFISGHNGRGKPKKPKKPTSDGYELIYLPNHPFCQSDGYIRRHRLIMEKFIGRYLRPDEEIHHIDFNKENNHISNLQILSKEEHARLHGYVDTSGRRCSDCNSTITRWDKRGWYDWFDDHKGGWRCRKCHRKWKYYNKKDLNKR